jgi:ribosomal protein S18 acetylase RimI-like enzyme
MNLGLNHYGLIRKIKRRMFSQISYRMASPSDVPSVAKFCETDLKEMLQEIEEGGKYYLAEKGGKVVGGLTAGSAWEGIDHDHRCWIMGLYVVPRYRGASVAGRLLAKAISTLKEQGIDQIFVNVFGNNNPALKLFHKLGFIRADMPEIESKINEHYAKVAPGSPRSFVLYKKI